MATRFELVMNGPEPSRLRSAGEEALTEIERLDRQLSAYDPGSDVSWINAHAAREPVKVEPRLFRLLQQAQEIHELTDGAFDVTVGPLMRVWGFAQGERRVPGHDEIQTALGIVGTDKIVLDGSNFTVRFAREGMKIDLGAIGKGYAIEQAVELLIESGITSALNHGGTSSIHAIGSPPGQDRWRVAVRDGETVELRDSSLSVSAVHGKSFIADGVEYGHVIDPRTGSPVAHTRLAAVTGPSATFCDALSTAVMVLGEGWVAKMEGVFAGYRGNCV